MSVSSSSVASDKNATTSGGGFDFGSAAAVDTPAVGFDFGNAAAVDAPAVGFDFGGAAAVDAPEVGFSFGGATDTGGAVGADASSSTGFNFGSDASSNGAEPSAAKSTAAETPEKAPTPKNSKPVLEKKTVVVKVCKKKAVLCIYTLLSS